MKKAALDRSRASALMQAQAIDALVVVQPENFLYATGAKPGFAALWRRAGTAIAIIPADPELSAAVVIADASVRAFRAASSIEDIRTHPLWTELADLNGLLPSDRPTAELVATADNSKAQRTLERPATYDLQKALDQVSQLLEARGLNGACLGIELDFIPVNDYRSFREALPGASFCDSSNVFRRLRMIKNAEEIENLKLAAMLAEAGIEACKKRFESGQSATDIAFQYRLGVLEEARARSLAGFESTWDLISVGSEPWGVGTSTAVLKAGDQIKFDVGCTVAGYQSDIGRTYVFGQGNKHQRCIHNALLGAFEAGLEHFKPGNPISDVYYAAQKAMHDAGFGTYIRGHFGHGIGANVWHEEWPYICSTEHMPLAPGMVFSFETPYYVDGVGGFIIEDQIVVTENGYTSLNSLPRDFMELH